MILLEPLHGPVSGTAWLGTHCRCAIRVRFAVAVYAMARLGKGSVRTLSTHTQTHTHRESEGATMDWTRCATLCGCHCWFAAALLGAVYTTDVHYLCIIVAATVQYTHLGSPNAMETIYSGAVFM
jgi:hypothetical protein